MKELTIEEKAKAYDKALVIARSRYSIETEESVRICLELMFSELKESEDERIRKGLIQYFSTFSLDTFAGLVPKKIIAWLEKQGEQKPDDKVDPKFKVGDWIVTDTQTVLFVDKIYEYDYYVIDTNNWLPYKYTIKVADEKCHPWTIQDAKDGDVLALNNDIFIYVHRKQLYSIAVAHCFVDSDGEFYLDGEFGYEEYGETISPATKEQRDTLFTKMREVGYEWDAKKKELKKIEQNPAWSEEDEKMLEDCIGAIAAADYYPFEDKQKMEKWLKSLKDRMKGGIKP